MKFTLILAITLLSLSAFAAVDPKNCPDKISITYSGLEQAPITEQIENNIWLKAAWQSLQNIQPTQTEFNIISRTDTALCVYSNGIVGLLLQTNNFSDELIIPVSNASNLYMRAKVLSFDRNHIETSEDKDLKNIYSPLLSPNPDSTEVFGEVKVGSAKTLNIK